MIQETLPRSPRQPWNRRAGKGKAGRNQPQKLRCLAHSINETGQHVRTPRAFFVMVFVSYSNSPEALQRSKNAFFESPQNYCQGLHFVHGFPRLLSIFRYSTRRTLQKLIKSWQLRGACRHERRKFPPASLKQTVKWAKGQTSPNKQSEKTQLVIKQMKM